MTSDKKKKLQLAVTGIQRRWGNNAIGLVKKQPPIPHISTSFTTLDKATGIGGIPRGRISEIVGVPTSGMATLAVRTIANAQMPAGTAVYLDLERTFDPDYADTCGVDLRRLILVHPYSVQEALAMVPDFIINGGLDMLVVDMPLHIQSEPNVIQALSATLGRLIAPLSKTGCALLFLTTLLPGRPLPSGNRPQQGVLPYYAALRLLIQKERWLYRQQDVAGYEAQVLVAKNKLGTAGKSARITITFNGSATRGKT